MRRAALAISILSLISAGCTTTFGGTVLVISMGDILMYIFAAFLIALLIGAVSENGRRAFWIWLILSLVTTPLTGLIYLLSRLTRRKKRRKSAS